MGGGGGGGGGWWGVVGGGGWWGVGGGSSQYKDVCIGIPMLKIRRSRACVITLYVYIAGQGWGICSVFT